MKAINLEQVISFFDPTEMLRGQRLAMWFVDRASSPRFRLAISLRNQQRDQKWLFIGHRGSGKSTELNKLAGEIADGFHTIGFDILDVTGRSNLRYEDLMLALSTRVTAHCIDANLIGRPLSDPLQERWRDLADWWRQLIAGLDLGQEHEIQTYASFKTLLGEVEVGASQAPFTRDQLTEQVNRQMPELIRRLNWVIDQAHNRLNPKRLLLVVEGLDKVDLDVARSIFRDHSSTITAPKAAMVFTFPLALRYSEDYQTVQRQFGSEPYFLWNFAVRHRDGTDDEDGISALRQIVLHRMERQLIEDEALNHLVLTSGGLPVDLIKLARSAATYAIDRYNRSGDSGAERRISTGDAANAIRDARRELAANLSLAEWRILKQRRCDRQISNELEIQRLLYKGALIEYSNDIQWCDVHPLLWSLLEQYAED